MEGRTEFLERVRGALEGVEGALEYARTHPGVIQAKGELLVLEKVREGLEKIIEIE